MGRLTLFAQFVQRFRMAMRPDTAFVGTRQRIPAAGLVETPADRTTDDVTLSHYPLHRRAFGVLVGDPPVEPPSRFTRFVLRARMVSMVSMVSMVFQSFRGKRVFQLG